MNRKTSIVRRDICNDRVIPPMENYEKATSPVEKNTSATEPKITGWDYVNMQSVIFTRHPKTRFLPVTSDRKLILQPPHIFPYMLSNPDVSLVSSTPYLIFNGTVSTGGNTQGNPINVLNHLKLHMYMDVTSISGQWDIITQSRDSYSLNWYDTQTIFRRLNSTGRYYNMLGEFGIDTQFAIRWNPVVAGSITFTMSATTKETISNVDELAKRTIFIGGNDVTINNGYPLALGESKVFSLPEGLDLWAVSETAATLKVFTM